MCFLLVPAAVVVWDSKVQDGYKRSRDAADTEQAPGKESRPAAAAWDGKKSSSVVEELLKNATDKAYGTEGELELFQAHFVLQTVLTFNRVVFFSLPPPKNSHEPFRHNYSFRN